MKYSYFPGCSLKCSGCAYDESFLATCRVLDIDVRELDDWNCCGATTYMSVDELQAYALSARNLALAEKSDRPDVVAPCGGCFGVLVKTEERLKKYPALQQRVNDSLKADGLAYTFRARIRHPLDVLAADVGLKKVRSKVVRPLKGLKVACYYGCRLVRPIATFDAQFDPQTMDNLLKNCGARLVPYSLKARCCGGSLAGTVPQAAHNLCYLLLKEAQRREADVIATACPLCQFNLECYQDEIARAHPGLRPIPVLYFTQLIGLALGADTKDLGLQRQIVPVEALLRDKKILDGAPAPKKEAAAAGKGGD